MALLFSAVTVTANDQEVEFLVGGIPREFDDLEGWTAFENFMEDIDEETEVSVHAKAYLYGGEETYKATPEEVAYFMKRIEMDDTFLSRCDNIEDNSVAIVLCSRTNSNLTANGIKKNFNITVSAELTDNSSAELDILMPYHYVWSARVIKEFSSCDFKTT